MRGADGFIYLVPTTTPVYSLTLERKLAENNTKTTMLSSMRASAAIHRWVERMGKRHWVGNQTRLGQGSIQIV